MRAGGHWGGTGKALEWLAGPGLGAKVRTWAERPLGPIRCYWTGTKSPAWDHPVLRIGPRTKLGYYSQGHETLDLENSSVKDADARTAGRG